LEERRALGFPLMSEEKRQVWYAAHPEDAPAAEAAPEPVAA
jgi:hypothetical protein